MENITIATLMAGRFYSFDAWLWGLQQIDYPKENIDLIVLSNAQSESFHYLAQGKLKELGFNSFRYFTSEARPSTNAFLERGVNTDEHADVIALLYNELYQHIDTDYFLLLEDDIMAPSNAITGLLPMYDYTDVGYTCGVQMCRHNNGIFMWDLKCESPFGPNDTSGEKTYSGQTIDKPWGVREIGLGHFGLTLLRREIVDTLPRPIFKPRNMGEGGSSLVGCDMVMCLELHLRGKKRIGNFNVRALHMDSSGEVH